MNLFKVACSLGQIQEVVSLLQEHLNFPAAVFLHGEVGSGKTTLVREFLKTWEGQAVDSPSYNIFYETPQSLHADFYRLKRDHELYEIDFFSSMEGKRLALIEWGRDYQELIATECENFKLYALDILQHQATHREYILRTINLT